MNIIKAKENIGFENACILSVLVIDPQTDVYYY